MKKLFIVALALTMSGCMLTTYMSEVFSEMKDSNQYEAARSLDNQLCDSDILARLQKTRTKAWYEATVKDCQSRKEQNIPLAN